VILPLGGACKGGSAPERPSDGDDVRGSEAWVPSRVRPHFSQLFRSG
jgi:hypothetical protein